MIAAVPAVPVRRAALRYHGGKFRLAPWLVGLMPAHACYVEPYGGAMSVLLQKEQADTEIYNDLDDRVVEYFEVLRDPVQFTEFQRLLSLTPYHERELQLAQEWHEDKLERARRLAVLSFMSFGSDAVSTLGTPGFRSSRTADGTTPLREWRTLPVQLEPINRRLASVVYTRKPALRLMKDKDDDDVLFYVDPPYHPSTRSQKKRKGVAYHAYRHELTEADHEHLLVQLRRMRGMVMLSGYRCAAYDEALHDWVRLDYRAQSDAGDVRTESVWINPQAAALRPAPDLFEMVS